MLHFMMWVVISGHGLMAGWWFIQSRKLKMRNAQFRRDITGFIEESLTTLSELPQWRESCGVVAFLTQVARREDVPEDLREDAKLLMPIDAAVLVEEDRPPSVH